MKTSFEEYQALCNELPSATNNPTFRRTLPSDGYADGGTPYTDEEMQIIERKEAGLQPSRRHAQQELISMEDRLI